MVEQPDANPEVSSPLEGAIADSPAAMNEAQAKVTETPTPQEGETPPVKEEQGEAPLHEHPRFKEVVDEKNWYKQQLEQLVQKPVPQPQQPQSVVPQPQTDEEKFWQNVGQVAQRAVQPQIQAGVNEIASLRASLFQRDHPDIKEGSSEYHQIVQKVSQGYLPEDAYKTVMWDKKVVSREASSQQQQQQRLADKRKANVVSPQSNSQASAPGKKETWDEELVRRVNTENIDFDS